MKYKLMAGRVGAGGFKCPCCRFGSLKYKRVRFNRKLRLILKRLLRKECNERDS